MGRHAAPIVVRLWKDYGSDPINDAALAAAMAVHPSVWHEAVHIAASGGRDDRIPCPVVDLETREAIQ